MATMTKQSAYMRYILLAAALLATVGAAVWYRQQNKTGIVPYDAARDRAFTLQFFKENWYWLFSDYTPNYSVERLLDYRTPNNDDLREAGKLSMFTYVIKGKPVGFVHIYEKELKVGQILFLGVHKDFQGKGYARELMKFAINEHKKRGMVAIRMNMRSTNEKARPLYESLGFKQIWTDGAYTLYELIL